MTRVAVDLLGAGAPTAVIDGVTAALRDDASLAVVVVGPADLTAAVLREHGGEFGARLGCREAADVVDSSGDALRAVRARRHASVRVATRLVRDGHVDAVVSTAAPDVLVAASLFVLGLLPGATRPALAATVHAPVGRVVLLDVAGGAHGSVTSDLLAQYALAGAAYASEDSLPSPTVGLLSAGGAPPTADGPAVTGAAVARGGVVDVVVTDGYTGAIVLSVVRGGVAGSGADPYGGAAVLGVGGIAVHANAVSAAGVAAGLASAARAHRLGVVTKVGAALETLVVARRTRAGLPA